jgi:hypothetical protein
MFSLFAFDQFNLSGGVMKRNTFALVITVAFLFNFSICSAHEKVVVVPLNSSKIVEVSSQPYQYSSSDIVEISSPNTVLITGEGGETVPEGKRFFLQNLSFQISSENVNSNPLCKARVQVDEPYRDVVLYPLLMTKTTSGTRSVFTSTNSLMLYADPGQSVNVLCTINVDSNVYEYFSMSGYFIDL